MKTFRNIALIVLGLVLVTIIVLGIVYKINTSPVNKSDDTVIEVVIPEGATAKTIGKILEDNDLIRSSTFFNIYVKLFHKGPFKASKYPLTKSMDLEEIIDTLEKGNSYNEEQITIMFKPGINIMDVATIIDKNTNNSYDDVIALVNDNEYIDELIEKYWFITEDIKNSEIYYKLEGYLAPDTYFYNNKDVTVKEIFAKMLNQTDKILSRYKEDIENSNMSVHDILTMASILEKEGKTRDFKNISSVFYNRIKIGMQLQSCATSIYGAKEKFDNSNRVITNELMQAVNPYNTYVIKALPVGPISLISEEALDAALNPNETEYYYFLSDNEGKTYFFKTDREHANKKNELISVGKWN